MALASDCGDSGSLSKIAWRLRGAPRYRRVSRAAAALCVILLISSGCSNPATQAGEQDQGKEVRLSVVAGLVGTRILVQNHSSETLQNVTIQVTDANSDTEFRHTVRKMASESTNTYLISAFKAEDGTALDLSVHEIDTFAVDADTPRGRGHWSGSY